MKPEEVTQGYRPEFWPVATHGGPVGVAEICSIIHEITNGTMEYFPGSLDNWIQCLEWLRDNWKHPSSMWDRALLTLVIRTLNERKPKPTTPPDLIHVSRSDQ